MLRYTRAIFYYVARAYALRYADYALHAHATSLCDISHMIFRFAAEHTEAPPLSLRALMPLMPPALSCATPPFFMPALFFSLIFLRCFRPF